MAFTQVTITQDYDLANGLDPSGSVSFTPTSPMVNAGVQVPAVKVTGTLDLDGLLSISLDANTDPGTLPAGSSYLVEELIGGIIRRYSVQIPHDQGASVVLSSLVPAGPAPILTALAQPLDADLTVIAGLSPTNDDVLQRKAGAWTNRSMTQLAVDLGVSIGGSTTPHTLSASSGVITPDSSTGALWRFVASTDITLAPPINGVDGDLVFVEVSATGSPRILSFQGDVPDPVTIAVGTWWTGAFRYHASPADLWVLDDGSGAGGGSSGGGGSSYTDEQVQDVAAALFTDGSHTGISFSYDDAGATVNATVSGSSYTDEQAQDAAASLFTTAAHTGISFSYDDTAGTLAATVTGGSSYTDEQAQDAAAALLTGGSHVGISFSYNDAGNALNATVSGGGSTDAAAPYGRVFLDDFAGGTDDIKLAAALSACAADTYPRTITLANRSHTFANTQTPYAGLRIQGPPGYSNPEQAGGVKMGCKIILQTGSSAGWFHYAPASANNIFSVTLRDLSFVGNSSSTVLTNNVNGNWYCLAMSGIYAYGLRTVLGTQTQKFICTAASFTGDWEINSCYNGAFHIGGSDNVFWSDGILIDAGPAFATAGSANGQYHLWLDFCEKSSIGPAYITAEGAWSGIKVSGPAYNTTSGNQGGPLTFYGLRLEGHGSSRACNGSLFRQEGGLAILRDCWVSYGMISPTTPGHSPNDAGIIHHAAGTLVVDGCTYDRATGVAETVPWIYTNSNVDCIVRSAMRAAKGGAWTGRPRVAKPTANTENRITDATVTLLSV